MMWMLNIATSPKAEWIGLSLGIMAIVLLMAGTIVTGLQKRRLRLEVVLSLLAVAFGIGFLVMLLISKRETAYSDQTNC